MCRDQAVLLEAAGKVLRDPMVCGARGAAEPVKGEVETVTGTLLDIILGVAIGLNAEPGLLGGEFSRRAMFIRGANEGHLMSRKAHIPRIHVRRQHRAGEVAQMFHPIDVGER